MLKTHFPDNIPFRTGRPLSSTGLAVLGVLVLIGAGAAIFAGMAGETQRMWQALLVNWLFWSSIAIGMVIFAVALHITEADWAWAVRRTAMAGVGFLPISFLLFIVVLFGYEYYFQEWLAVGRGEVQDAIVQRKLPWLNMPFLVTRNVLAVLIVFGLAVAFVLRDIRPDVYGAGEDRHRGFYDRITRKNWLGVKEEARRTRRVLAWMAPVFALLFAILWGMVGMDMVMTMEAHWFSTMFPVAFFVTSFVAGIAATAIALTWFRGAGAGLRPFLTRNTYHDLGKLVFAFAAFWMYINWSQYIVIWYAMWPHEQAWMIDRLNPPYDSLVLLTVILIFVLPFFGLLAREPKKIPAILSMFAGFILVGIWLERFLIVVPSIWPVELGLPLGLVELGVTLGFGALFVGSYLWAASMIPLLPSPATLEARKPVVEASEVMARD